MEEYEERDQAQFAHLSAFLGCIVPLGNIWGPTYFFFKNRKRSEYAVYSALEAINFQISMTFYMGASIWFFIYGLGLDSMWRATVGFLLIIILAIMYIVFPLIASRKVTEGIDYFYPLNLRLIRWVL